MAVLRTSLAIAAALVCLTPSSSMVRASGWFDKAPQQCQRCPLCSAESIPFLPGIAFPTSSRMSCWSRSAHPRRADMPEVLGCLRRALGELLVGQTAAADSLMDHLSHKLLMPSAPMVLHFAGDNGVGKSYAAELISNALSLRYHSGCGDGERCTQGDAMVVISCPSYEAQDVATIRREIVGKVVGHLRQYPRGIVLLDDAQSLPPEAFNVLSPLLGTAPEFPEAPGILLSNALVILTSDFGREGRTRGLSQEELKPFVEDELQAAYRYSNVKHVYTIPFMPLEGTDAAKLVRQAVANTPCRHVNVQRARATDGAVTALIRRLNEAGSIRSGNGREVQNEVERQIDKKVSAYALDAGGDVKTDVRLGLGPDGQFSLAIRPVDGLSPEHEL